MGPIGRTSQGPLAAFQADCEGLWGRAFVRNEIVCRNRDYLRLCEKMHMHLFCFSVRNRGVPVQPVCFYVTDCWSVASNYIYLEVFAAMKFPQPLSSPISGATLRPP